VNTLGKQLRIVIGRILRGLRSPPLKCDPVSLVLDTLGGDETLDLGGFGVWFLAFTLGLNLSSDNEFSNIVLLVETKELANLGGTLRTKALGVDDVGQARNIVVALLDDRKGKDGEILSNDAATDRLALAFTAAARTVAGMTFREEKSDTGWKHNTLLHRETLLVVTTSDTEDIAFPLVAETVTCNFIAHALVHEDAHFAVIVKVE